GGEENGRGPHPSRADRPGADRRGGTLLKRATVALLLGAALAGCKIVGPNYQRPPVAIPDQFYGASGRPSAASLADAPGFDVFGAPTLRSLIDEALRNGYDARIAAARVEEAWAR